MSFEAFKKPEDLSNPKTPESTEVALSVMEIKEGEPGYENAFAIGRRPGDTRTPEAVVLEALQVKYWFLREDWKNKEVKERFTVRIGGEVSINIFNFGENLTEEQKKVMGDTLKDYARYQTEILGKVDTILIDNMQYLNKNTGKPLNGRGGYFDGAIKLYPNAFKGEHRIAGASNLEGTIIHELSHSMSVDFRNNWGKKFDWQELEIPEDLPGGGKRYHAPKDKERCVTEYAQVSPAEDLCESMVAFLKNPGVLDKEKLIFLQESFPLKHGQANEVDWQTEVELKIPKLDIPIKYKIVAPKRFSIQK